MYSNSGIGFHEWAHTRKKIILGYFGNSTNYGKAFKAIGDGGIFELKFNRVPENYIVGEGVVTRNLDLGYILVMEAETYYLDGNIVSYKKISLFMILGLLQLRKQLLYLKLS